MMDTERPIVPYGRQSIEQDDIDAVVASLRSPYLTTGPEVASLEREFADAVGAKHAVAVCNGTAALHLCMMAAGVGEGDFVAVPSVTFLASANCARYVGAEVLFTDVDPTTGLMTPETLEAALTRLPAGRRLKAVIPVHLTGMVVDMPAVRSIATRADATVVEDACHAIGSSYAFGTGRTSLVGACDHSDIANFSLHPVKTITMGEGGIITTNDAALAKSMATFRTHGMVRDPAEFLSREQGFSASGEPNPWYYEMPDLGYNYRATDMQCALGRSQLRKLPRFVARRKQIAARYDALLADLAPVLVPQRTPAGCDPALHLYVVHIDFAAIGKDRARVFAELKAEGVLPQVHYLPVSRQPYYVRRYGPLSLPGADAYYNRILSIPLYPDMTEEDVDRVVGGLRKVIQSA